MIRSNGFNTELQHTINKLDKLTLENGFTISRNKTVAMHFWPDKNAWILFWSSTMNLSNLQKVLHFTVWFRIQNFEPHILSTSKHDVKNHWTYLVLSRTEFGADRTTLLKLYWYIVIPKLDYGCILCGSAAKTSLTKIDPVHNQGHRHSVGAFRSSPVKSLYVEADEAPW